MYLSPTPFYYVHSNALRRCVHYSYVYPLACSFLFLFALFNFLSRLSCSFCLLFRKPKKISSLFAFSFSKHQKYFLLFLVRLFPTSFLVTSSHIENSKNISLLVLRYFFHYLKITKIFSLLLCFVVVPEFQPCL